MLLFVVKNFPVMHLQGATQSLSKKICKFPNYSVKGNELWTPFNCSFCVSL